MRHEKPPLRLVLILGSTRPGRFCDIVASWVLDRLEAFGPCAIDVIDPALFDAEGAPEELLQARMLRADGFIVVTPEYNHGYPAPLKALIDATQAPWHAKPVAFVSYGGISGGLRAVEQLRQVLAELHTVGVRDTVSFANAQRLFDEQGALREPAAAEAAMERLLRRLHWWAQALREARRQTPFAEAA